MIRICISLFFILIVAAGGSQVVPVTALNFPRIFSIPLLSVQQTDGNNEISLSKKTLYVYVFLSPECPLCRHYIPELKRLQQVYGKDIIINGIVPGRSYSRDTLNQFANEYNINFPLYIDSARQLSNYLTAKVTPEVMVFTKNAEKIYSGAIDDWMKELGVKRVKPSLFYLEDALSATIKGKKVNVPKTEAKGCLINDL